jgi:hypothetical protein
MNDDAIRRALDTRLALPLVAAGRALGLGRRRTKAAAEAGQIPVTPAGTVPTWWLRQALQLDQDDDGSRAAKNAKTPPLLIGRRAHF